MQLDQKALIRGFSCATHSYDEAAVVHKRAADEMLERLSWIKLQPENVVDVGGGSGFVTSGLRSRFPQASIWVVDLLSGWPQSMASTTIRADAMQLPFATGSCDLVVSNLVFHCCDIGAALGEAGRVLRPGGLLMFSTFGPDTLIELRDAWAAVDDAPHVHEFIDMHDIGDGLLHGGFSDPVMDAERYTVTHKTVNSIVADLRATGEINALTQRRKTLTGKNRFAGFRAAMENQRLENELYPVSYEVIFGHAWKPENRGSVRVSEIS